MRDPYRVILVGPGAVGRGALFELVRRPEFEVVGVLGFSPSKEGMDIGELLDQPPVGIKVTTDRDAILALQADCVVWCGTFPFKDIAETMDRLVIQLLESGKNVVTPVCYHYPNSHDEAYVKKFEDACKKGGTSLHGTGENPGFWFERVALTLTGLCNDVDYIHLDEYCDVSTSGGSQELYNAVGFGVPLEVASASGPLSEAWQSFYFIETLNLASMSLYGKELEKFEHRPEYIVCDEAYSLSRSSGDAMDMQFSKGSVRAQTHHFHGYVDGEPKLNISVNWFFTPEHSPFGDKKDSTWSIQIEGRPLSIKCDLEVMASIRDNLEFRPGETTSPTYYATAQPAVQAIPVVCGAEPGIVYPSIFTSCAPDQRLLETRNTVVDN